MERLFRIDFYPSDWLVQTGKMTLGQRGLFIQIVSMIYANRGPIENDPAWIGRASNCSPRMARSIIYQLAENGSIQIEGSKITQKRCEHELNLKRTHLEHAANGGRTSRENERVSNEINGIASTTAPAQERQRLAAGKNEFCRKEELPSEWHSIAEAKGIPDAQIYKSWSKFKERSSQPFQLKNWRGWIYGERVR